MSVPEGTEFQGQEMGIMQRSFEIGEVAAQVRINGQCVTYINLEVTPASWLRELADRLDKRSNG